MLLIDERIEASRWCPEEDDDDLSAVTIAA